MARTFKILVALVLGLGIIADASFAGISTGAPAAPIGTPALVPALSQPNWEQLTPEQRSVLKPLANDWPAMESYRRKKWLGIAQRYSTMSAEEKLRVGQRMKDWASLTPEQRSQARANYKSLKQVPPDHKEDIKRKWEEYSQLPIEQRDQLKAEAARKPLVRPLVPLVRPMPQKSVATPLAGELPNNGVSPAPTGTPAVVSPIPKPATPGKP